MGLKDDILKKLIADDDYISGERLANEFDKSRAAVWKAIKSLEKDGYTIDAVTNKGYRLKKSNMPLTEQGIKAYLSYDIDVIHLKTVDSTNNYCKRLLANSKDGAFLVCADNQTAGRGRQGKSFYSPCDTGVYFTLVIRPDTNLSNAVTATTAAAVAVCKAIETLTALDVKIKWVNDVYLNGKKICGILTEAITDFESQTVDSVIVGIGINISTSDFPDGVDTAGSLNVDINKAELIATIANELMNISGGDYSSFIDYYRSHSMIIGEKIKFIQNSVTQYATALSIDERGGLEVVLDETNEHIVLRSGEITVRKI